MQTIAETIDESTESAAAAMRYRSLSVCAILSLVFGLLSILTVFGWVFWTIPLIALSLAYRALKKIRYAATEFVGIGFARAGIVTALVLWPTGAYIRHYIKQHSIPTGYKAITFDYLQPNPNKADEFIPPAAYDLEPDTNNPDKRIFIRGFIYPGRRTLDIKSFILVPTLGHCQFCSRQLKSTEMIKVTFTGDLKVDYTAQPIGVGGKLHIDRDQVLNPFGGLPYQLEADYLQE
ncbi:MAG: hypothetical protein ACWGMZ_06740 [Thermoguttaceae bacterium]